MANSNPIDIYEHLEPRQGGEAVRSVARFLWIDRESGEELSVEVTGAEEFFEKLESLGFERLLRLEATSDACRAGRVRRRARMDVRSAAQRSAARSERRGA